METGTETGTIDTTQTTNGTEEVMQMVVPIEIREYTPFVTESGNINVIHEITLGDLLVSTLIMALLVFTVIGRIVRR